jgi:hypothetical protein
LKNSIFQTRPGEGLKTQAWDHPEFGDAQVVEVEDIIGSKKVTYYWVKSERFPTKYYILSRQNGQWFFSGEKTIAATYIAKVEAYLASKAKTLEVSVA